MASRLKILFAAYPLSIHLRRWISHIRSEDWEIHLWYSRRGFIPGPDSPDGSRWTRTVREGLPKGVILHAAPVSGESAEAEHLAQTIGQVAPHLVHSICMQEYGYVTREARKAAKGSPPWILSNGGNDLCLYGRFPEHRARCRQTLRSCDFYFAECARDMKLARELGFSGRALPVFPAGGGFDLEALWKKKEVRPSRRRLVLLKGYHHELGRALVGLRAIELCAPFLKGYRIGIYGAKSSRLSASVPLEAERLARKTGLKIGILPEVSHREQLLRHGKARVSIGLAMSDGISASLLEAMVMGSFPIQSSTACAAEWIRHGKTGFIVPPEDPERVARALKRALTDDALVDQAWTENRKVARSRLNSKMIATRIRKAYEHAADVGSAR